jgi:hypothetical protein
MDTQQMLELLLARLDANQAKADARHGEVRSNQTKAETGHKELLGRLEADRQANMKAWKEEIAAMRNKRMNANYKEMVAELEPKNDKETLACRETTEACPEEKQSTSLDRKPEASEQREVPAEDATIMPVGELRKLRKDRKVPTNI